ncbi:MAG: copper resistance protein CopC [Actinomycetes bacterium]
MRCSASRRPPLRTTLVSASLATVAALLATAPAFAVDRALADAQRLVAVSPANGELVAAVPEQVRLTFAEPLESFSVRLSVRTPSGEQAVSASLAGTDAVFSAPHEGPGHYVVDYAVTPGDARGQTGFTVLAPGESAPRAQTASPLWAVAGVLLLVGVGFVLVRLVRSWRLS